MYLINPLSCSKDEYLAYIQELDDLQEEYAPYSLNSNGLSFQDYVNSLTDVSLGVNIPDGWVSASTYFLVDEHQKIYGAVNIRHKLTPQLLQNGGHIEYGIRPSERGNGYGNLILALALERAKQYLELDRVLIVCEANNINSARIIRANDGILESELTLYKITFQRYWIDLNMKYK